ncbi:alpha-mannosidase [Coleofasciculus sp. FACHB-1120]|uniref:alpha-mannosidase n=1 Tax=Coleofasciculus sp. FACHB-1120 TaxID=2692783 RepID=UPI0016886EAF|nr:alpha-mannosidase [Coleofasciculus sp. FACHB-1120]MBD2744079.1 alpha-mannosidase [Coleofasciculus sp. FACHB-1120]
MTDSKTPFVTPSSSLLSEAIEKLSAMTQVNVQTRWRYCAADLTADTVRQSDFGTDWLSVELNARGHIAWEAGQKVLWLSQKLIIPQDLHLYPLSGLALRLVLTWWAEDAQIFVNGVKVQAGDLFDCSTRVLLSPAVTPGEEITVALRLVSPGHDDGALVRSLCVYEFTTDERIEPGFVADELAVLQRYLKTFEPEKLDILASAVAEIDWTALPDGQKFERSLSALRENLLDTLGSTESKIQNLKSQICLLGHAHLDLAWLWPVSDTWEAAQRTFESVLKLLQEFPKLIFCHSTPALYAWIEQHRPDLFAAIQQQVAAGRWEVVGGMWVEPELNIINGESIIRQLLYGQRYVLEKFGQLSTVAWLPDSFGFCATLPQFLKSGGIEYFVTQKLRWNDTTKFPYEAFWWRSPDGSQIFSLMSAPIGEGIDPMKMASYACDWETQTSLKECLWLPGVGDHGGGPTRDMLEVAHRWEKSPFFPRLEFTTSERYLQQISTQNPNSNETQNSRLFPVWDDELYLEFHRGCYTTHADQKRFQRRSEGLLYQAELFASLASISIGAPYPKQALESAWKKVLFNQFHDILPGSSIPQVFVDANRAWQEVEQVGSEIVQQALRAIATSIALPPPPQPDALPVIVFNSLNWQRSEVVAVPLPASKHHWQVYNLEGKLLPSQLSEGTTLLFLAENIPSVGYRLFWLYPQNLDPQEELPSKRQEHGQHSTSFPDSNAHNRDNIRFSEKNCILENDLLRVIVDSQTGDLSSVFDKINHREILSQVGGNQLQAFQDSGQYWDAWNIDPNYAQHPLPPTQLKSIEWVEQGAVQTRLRVVRQLGESKFCQDYVLQADSPLLKIVTTVDWQERHVLVKAAFPLTLTADSATYEIPCGAIVRSTRDANERTTQPQTPAETAKWEVPALHWADLADNGYGVSLLNDCKYGYDAEPSQLRLTLLRGSTWPDPDADQGWHQFTYALYPHQCGWQSAHTVRRGYELNLPLQVMLLPSVGEQNSSLPNTSRLISPPKSLDPPLPPLKRGVEEPDARNMASLPPVGQLLDLHAENLILIALKQSEDNLRQWILRCYECHGEEAQMQLNSDLDLAIAHPVDLLERPIDAPEMFASGQIASIQPWKIATFVVKRTDG